MGGSRTAAAPDSPQVAFRKTHVWHELSPEDVARLLGTSTHGLKDEDAVTRLEAYGPNEIAAEKETPWWRILLHQFADPLIYILLVAALLTLVIGDYADFGVILAVVVTNALIGYPQERRAHRAMTALTRLSTPRADVVRGGETRTIASREVVPGDIVVLTSGARVPADLRLLQVLDLDLDESLLTGESLPVRKSTDAVRTASVLPGDQVNMAFAGTTVTRGRGRGIVVRTGAETELGRIATTMRELGETTTPLQEKMKRFGNQIGLLILVLATVVAMIGLARSIPPGEILLAAVAMAVSAVPEGLPVVLTLTFAIGIRRMARRHAIIRSLPAVETLGSATVIGSDKTGTLTRNEMVVEVVWAAGIELRLLEGRFVDQVDGEVLPLDESDTPHACIRETLMTGVLANEADPRFGGTDERRGDPTELALYAAASSAGMDPVRLREDRPQVDVLPFEPELRFMATLNETPEGRTIYMKGAPEVVLERCAGHCGAGEEAAQAIDRMAKEGYRVLAMAYKRFDGSRLTNESLRSGFVFAGVEAMEDPVRPEAVAAVRDAQSSGIRVIMLTGDHAHTALAVGRQIGLDPENVGAMEGREIEALTDEELDAALGRINLYARVAPEHKLRIVQRLKEGGHVVAVTGDGVNDAPALRAAHLGIAMGKSGTDVAREASDLVLTDDNFATITAAVEEGRIIFSNVRKVTFFLLSTAVGEIITITAAIILGWPLPFIAAQILWINLATNGLQDVALAFEPGEPGLLRRPPRPLTEGIITKRLLERLGTVGVVLAAGTLAMFWWAFKSSGNLAEARTMAMTQMVMFQFFHVFNSRSLDRSIFEIPLFSNRFLFASILGAVAAHAAVLYVPVLQAVFRTVPLTLGQWATVTLVGTLVLFGGELDKWRNRRRSRPLG